MKWVLAGMCWCRVSCSLITVRFNQMRLCFAAVLNKGNVLKSHLNRASEATQEMMWVTRWLLSVTVWTNISFLTACFLVLQLQFREHCKGFHEHLGLVFKQKDIFTSFYRILPWLKIFSWNSFCCAYVWGPKPVQTLSVVWSVVVGWRWVCDLWPLCDREKTGSSGWTEWLENRLFLSSASFLHMN